MYYLIVFNCLECINYVVLLKMLAAAFSSMKSNSSLVLRLPHTGFWKTSGCVIYRQTLQHEQKQSGQPVLQCGSGRLYLHSSKALPEFEAHWFRSSGNRLVSSQLCQFFLYPSLNSMELFDEAICI